MEQYQNVVQDLAGNVVPEAVVRVLLPNGGDAQIFDANGAPTFNPTPCDAEGYFYFQAANGKYFAQVEVANKVYKKLGPVTLYDPEDDADRLTPGDLTSVDNALQDRIRAVHPGDIRNYDAVSGQDCYAAIEAALASNITIVIPPGTWLTSAGSSGKAPHRITGKSIIGVSREVSIIQATGVNEGRTLFVNDVTDVNNPGIWGGGKDFRIEKVWIRGNWDTTSGLTQVTESGVTAPVGITKAAYNAATQTALIKGVSAAYPFIIDCYVDNAYEHGILCYRAGYAEISGNIVARCRGSGVWLTADSAANAITSAILERNQIVANRGGFGGLYTKYTYGCAIRDNRPFEDNTWGATFGEGADTDISGNYFEINPFGDAAIDPSLWGLTLVNNYWTIPPTLPSGGAARGFFSYDRKRGLRHLCVPGLGETDNRLGPVRYSCDSDSVGLGRGTLPAANGTGLTFPAVQDPSSNPDTFDDYKERSVTLSDGSGAALAITGTILMTKKGREITISGQMTFPITSSTADIQLNGIPTVGPAGAVGSVTDNAGVGATSALAPAGAVGFSFYPAGSFSPRTNASYSGRVVYFNLTYFVA